MRDSGDSSGASEPIRCTINTVMVLVVREPFKRMD